MKIIINLHWFSLVTALLLFIYPLLGRSGTAMAYYYPSENETYSDYEDSSTIDEEEYSYQKPDRFARLAYNSGNKVFIFDPSQLSWFAYGSHGQLIASGRASGGRGYCPDVGRSCRTPVGTFRVKSKGGPGCISSKFPLPYGGAPMPYCMFFHGGFAIHGSNDVPNHNASHGCVRVEPEDARWLNHEFMDIGTTVIVRSYGR